MKRSIAAFLALALALALPALAAGEAPYDDVGEDAPCYEAVQELYSAEIMQGSRRGLPPPGGGGERQGHYHLYL